MNQPIQEYLKNKYKQEQTRFIIRNGVGQYAPKLYSIPKKEFESWFPLGENVKLWDFYQKGENKNGQHVS